MGQVFEVPSQRQRTLAKLAKVRMSSGWQWAMLAISAKPSPLFIGAARFSTKDEPASWLFHPSEDHAD